MVDFKELEKLLKELPAEKFEAMFFPTLENLNKFVELTEYKKEQEMTINSIEDSKIKFEIMKKFFNKLKTEGLHDPMIDKLHDDASHLWKKIVNSTNPTFEKFRNNKNLEDIEKRMDLLCRSYASFYERTCKLYFKPLSRIIKNNESKTCGKAIKNIFTYEPETARVLEPFIPQIRNSINHSEYHYDYTDNVIIFEDEKKPPMGMPLTSLENACKMMIVNELCITVAHDHFKIPLWNLIINDSNDVIKYCSILQIDHDELLRNYLSRGISLFQIKWMLEQIIDKKNQII